VTQNGSTNLSYPLYDLHGNMVSTISRSGSSYSYSAERSFDAWGQIRIGVSTGDPKEGPTVEANLSRWKYCANLGHKQDDESGLIYMRARYYEPTGGRFINQDPFEQGRNWFSYCASQPVSKADSTGNIPLSDTDLHALLARLSTDLMFSKECKTLATSALIMMQTWLSVGILETSLRDTDLARKTLWIGTFQSEVGESNTIGLGSIEDKARAVDDAYAIMLTLSMWVFDEDTLYSLS